jgi:hypothetical protein
MCCVDVLRRGAFQSHGINYRRFTRVLRVLREALRFLRVLTRGGDGLKRTRLLLFFGLIGARLNKIGVLFLRVGTTIGSGSYCERVSQLLGLYLRSDIYILCIFNNRNGISRKSRLNSLLGRRSKILTTTIP